MRVVPLLLSLGLASEVGLSHPVLTTAQTAPLSHGVKGAATVIQQLKNPAPTPKASAHVAVDNVTRFRQQLAAFTKQAPTLAPVTAAQRWVALADRFEVLRRYPSRSDMATPTQPLEFAEVTAALPPPPSWNALRVTLEKRRPLASKRSIRDWSLVLLTHTLLGDRAAQQHDLQAMRVLTRTPSGSVARQRAYAAQLVTQIEAYTATHSADPKAAVRRMLLQLKSQGEYGATLNVPDLVTLVGRPQATQILAQAVRSRFLLSIEVGDETQGLARQLALQNSATMQVPQWGLVQTPDSTRLYEVITTRFGTSSKQRVEGDNPWNFREAHQQAKIYYLLGLIVSGRTQEAIALVTRMHQVDASDQSDLDALESDSTGYSPIFDTLDHVGYTRQLRDFLHALLSRNPDLPYWPFYVSTSTSTGELAPMLNLARKAAARPNLAAEQRQAIRAALVSALLATDNVDEAVTNLRLLMRTTGSATRQGYEPASYALQLAQVGQVMGRADWRNEGLNAALKQVRGNRDAPDNAAELVPLLVQANRAGEAETLLVEQIQFTKKQLAQSGGGYAALRAPLRPYLTLLIGLYHQLGRYQDVLLLMDKSPDWGAQDLADFSFEEPPHHGEQNVPLAYIVADSLAQTGQPERARPIIEAVLTARPDFDPAYAVLIKIEGEKSLPFLNTLFSRDQFEERPLIWKAQVLQDAGRLEEAEKTARAAVAIDPSDGEQGKNDRMRAYTVLANILDARDDKAEADRMRGAVRAIRLSEHADDLHTAGLLKRALATYEKSLTFFADAYCIQSRLAIQLAATGQQAQAEAHYRKAYELMPVSFGRMESHCFGCERAFAGKRAESIAERVFKGFVAKMPNNPRVRYLLGYLREEQGRYTEALALYQQAVALDHDYINAWGRIAGLSDHVQLPTALRDAVGLNMLRLDPQGRHSSPPLLQVSDLKALWNGVAAARKRTPPPSQTLLYPLPASKKAQQENTEELDATSSSIRFRMQSTVMESGDYDFGLGEYRNQYRDITPGQIIAMHPPIPQISQLISMG